MSNTMEYNGYVGSVEFSEKDGVFFGKVMGIRALISYEGTTAQELVEDFHGAVDDYLALCESKGKAPEKAYKGSFNVRISPELHKRAVISAAAQNILQCHLLLYVAVWKSAHPYTANLAQKAHRT